MLLVAAALAAALADWGLWDWAIAHNHGVIALVAGLAMAPLVVLLAFYALLAAVALANRAVARALGTTAHAAPTRLRAAPAPPQPPEEERLAA
jgi:hypothetical protein